MFPTTTRFHDRMYLSPEHMRVTIPLGMPGPGTYDMAGRFVSECMQAWLMSVCVCVVVYGKGGNSDRRPEGRPGTWDLR